MRLILLLSALLLLASCTTVSKVNVQVEKASSSKQLAYVCKARPIAVSIFDVMRSQVEIPDTTVAHVYQLSAGIKTICDNPPKNVAEALLTATRLYNEILSSQSGVALATATALADMEN